METLTSLYLKSHSNPRVALLNGEQIYTWLEQTSDQPFELEIEVLQFSRAIGQQYIGLSFFDSIVGEDSNSKQIRLRWSVDESLLKSPLKFSVRPLSSKKPAVIRVFNEWYSEVDNASFNPGERIHSVVGNAGVKIEEVEPGQAWILSCSAGVHPDMNALEFNDLVLSVQIAAT